MPVKAFGAVQRGPFRKFLRTLALWQNGHDALQFMLSKEGHEEVDPLVEEMKTTICQRAGTHKDLLELYYQDVVLEDLISQRGELALPVDEMEDTAFFLAYEALIAEGKIQRIFLE